ncbi:hypothetical protein AR539_09170 [Arthrobacter sp. EPSL27]|nr:hypothetical protein AR539_09170 [Arthrobacter sp. EPSL27]
MIAVMILLWAGSNNYRLSTVILAVSYSLIALGMYIPVAWANSLSLAYGAYGAIGAYSVAVIAKTFGLPVWLGWIVGSLLAAAIAVILALATARLLGFHLVAATLLFAFAFQTWLGHNPALGQANGLVGVPGLSLFGWVPSAQVLVTAGVALVLLIAVAMDRAKFSRWGIIVRSIGEAPLVVSTSGISVPQMTIVVLAIGAGVAALGGSFFVTSVGGITPETFNLNVVFLALFMPLLGGLGTAWGAVVGAALTVFLTVQWKVFSAAGGLLVLSIAVLVVLLTVPGGMLGLLSQAGSKVSRLWTARGGVNE